ALAEELLELAPDHVDALVAAAKGRAAGGDAAGALTALQQAQARAPGRADLHKLQGDVALKVGDKAGAFAAYRAALELDRGYVQVWLDLGRLHEEKEAWSEARQAYERALDALPTFHEAALALADLLRRSGHVRQAIVRLAEMLEQDPYDLLGLRLLGRALLDDKRDAQALEAFQRALKFDPEQVEALFQLGVALARLHRYGEAVQAWEKVTRIDPGGPFAQAARAHARTALDLKHIVASAPAAPSPIEGPLGEILVSLGALTPRELERQLRFQIEEVVFEVMSWREGYFSFSEGPPTELPTDATVRIPTEALLMEGARRIDEWSRIEGRIPHLGVVPMLAPPQEASEGELDLLPPEWEMLAMINGARDVRAIASELGRSDFEVAKTLFGLESAGVI